MKIFISFVSVLLGFSVAQAAQDSVAVFLRADKVVVLINEQYNGRLQSFMNHLGVGTDLEALSVDQGMKLSCGRRTDAATCTFRFNPSALVKIEDKSIQAQASLADLNLPIVSDFEMSFESSREDKMTLKIQNGVLEVKASKRVL